MLHQVIHWTQMTGTVVEGLLLIRILSLKLQRVYLWVTLYWTVNLLIDASSWAAGWESHETQKLLLTSTFLFAVLSPLAAWDVFEEVGLQITKLRRVHLLRLISSLFASALVGFFYSLTVGDQDSLGIPAPLAFMGLFLWLGSALASLLFTWNVLRGVRKQQLPLPHNTIVWTVFFLVTFTLAVLDCGMLFLQRLLTVTTLSVVEIIFSSFDICLSVWCVLRLRAIPSDTESIPENATS